MALGSHESSSGRIYQPQALYALADRLWRTPGGFDRYNYAKSVWMGNPDRQHRLAGEHPWPTRTRDGEQYVYSVPVLAAANAETQTVLFVGKDNWKHANDPNAWLVAQRELLSGEEVEFKVLGASVDAANDVRLSLAPLSYDNFPPEMQWAFRNRPLYDQTILSGRLDDRYNLQRATIREGLDGGWVAYEDIEALESMIIRVQQIRTARAVEQLRDSQIFNHELASRAMIAA